ncbi:hypothetical protein K439DRAFT_715742 [Ramaria rubella]|nr:hypothetical protein K439DRAFT_715742 [Ramaria rubella]
MQSMKNITTSIFRSHHCPITFLAVALSLPPLIAACDVKGEIKIWRQSTHQSQWSMSEAPLPPQLVQSDGTANTGVEFIHNTARLVIFRQRYIICWDASNGQTLWNYSLASFP